MLSSVRSATLGDGVLASKKVRFATSKCSKLRKGTGDDRTPEWSIGTAQLHDLRGEFGTGRPSHSLKLIKELLEPAMGLFSFLLLNAPKLGEVCEANEASEAFRTTNLRTVPTSEVEDPEQLQIGFPNGKSKCGVEGGERTKAMGNTMRHVMEKDS